MKILYIISTMGKKQGRGGHYFSLKTTAEEIQKCHDCVILNIGRQKSPTIESWDGTVYNIIYRFFNPLALVLEIKKIVDKEQPDVIHSFDVNALFFARVISIMYKKPHIHTKCGGPNPPRFFPYVKNLIVYSPENYQYFRGNKKFSLSEVYLIPNRISVIRQDIPSINEIRAMVGPEKTTFLRIGRISGYYRASIFQSINLVRKLNQNQIPSHLVLIGVIQDEILLNDLRQLKDDSVTLLTDDRYTMNASRLIDAAEFVIGTGRGFMEAASRGKVLLSPLQDSDLPVLITQKNFPDVFQYNFSERSIIKDFDPANNFMDLMDAVQSRQRYMDLSDFMRIQAGELFEIHNKADLFKTIYSTVQFDNRIGLTDLLVEFCILFKINYS